MNTEQPSTSTLSLADRAAHAAASYVTPKALAALHADRAGLSAKGLDALHRLEIELAWSER